MNNAIEMAKDAIELACISMEDANECIPAPSGVSDLDVTKGTFIEEGKTIISLVEFDSTEYHCIKYVIDVFTKTK